MKKYDFKISESEGKKIIEVPSEIIEQVNPLWDDFVIARFLKKAPHVAKMHMIVNKIWAYGEKNQKLDVYVMDDRTMRIRIQNEKIRRKMVGRGIWNVAGVPMVVSHWSPEEDKSKAGLTPIWVHVTNVPLSMYSWEGLSFITSATGISDHLHPETLACMNLEIAKVFVMADLSKDLPEKINYVIQGVDTTVKFIYPGLPSKCAKCGRWGHFETFCKEKELDGEVGKEKVDNQGEIVKVTEVQVDDKEEGEIEVMPNSDKKEEEKVEEVKENLERAEVNPWKEVLTEKASRSPKPLPTQEVITTPSRFAALGVSDDEERENEKENMDALEDETEGAEELYQSQMEDSVGGKLKETRRGRPRQTIPRKSKTNHRVVLGVGTSKNH